ncbi:MAG: HEPN domain-containing protein [Verrucomicrobiota bacterium]|jgi:HEPN domain-containing protein
MDEAGLELVKDWLTRAHQDLRAALILAAAEEAPLDVAIYHCQQAGEKAVKAFLQWRDEPFAKTHNLRALAIQAAALDRGFEAFEKASEILTPYVSAFRYPGGSYEPMPSREEFDEALQHAQTIYDFVLSLLPPEARP